MSAKERPILFSAPMVRAILSGAKTQTRRIVGGAAVPTGAHSPVRRSSLWTWMMGEGPSGYAVGDRACPYGEPGDRLWVRETFAWTDEDADPESDHPTWPRWVYYRADENAHLVSHDRRVVGTDFFQDSPEARWKPSIFMPRWASRVLLDVTDVRVERLQAITEEDALAEGVPGSNGATPSGWARANFTELWDEINGDRASWASNPWVWVVSFKRAES